MTHHKIESILFVSGHPRRARQVSRAFLWCKNQCKNSNNNNFRQSLLSLPWQLWMMQHKIEPILFVSCHPRWQRQVRRAFLWCKTVSSSARKHEQSLLQKSRQKWQRQQHATITAARALATLDGATQNRTNPICVLSPKVAKASKAGIFVMQNC
jgi:hypothetical protein